jgi:putative transposase
MTRLARIVIPGLAHHVTQRGNRREQVFFSMRITASIWMS